MIGEKMWYIMIKFAGEWGIWKKYKTRTHAEEGLFYYRERMSWPLMIVKM